MTFTPPAADEVVEGVKASQDSKGFVPPDPAIEPSLAGGIARSLAQGASFGFADEVEAAIRALGDEEDFGQAYLRNRDQVRQELEAFREARPGIALTSELVGGFAVPGLGTARAVGKGATLGAKVLRGSGAGAATGGLFGAGTAEEVEDIPRESAKGAAFGTAAGVVLPVAAAGVRRTISTTKAVISPEAGAVGRIGQSLRRDEITPKQIAEALDEAKQLGRPAKVADVGGEAVRRELEVAAQSPGAAGQLVEKSLRSRNREQLARISNDLLQGTGVKANAIQEAIDSTMTTRATAAAPVYARAMNFSAEVNNDIVNTWNSVTKTPLGKQAMGKARKILNVEDFDKAPLMERIDAFKRGLDDMIGASQRKGENAVARQALILKNDLVKLVDDVNPDYKNARQIWENGSSYLNAIDRGREVLQPTFTASKLAQEIAGMTNAEQEAFRIGAVDAVITRLRQQSAQEPNLIKLIRSPEMRDKLKAIMKPEQAARLDKILDLEDAMFRTAGQALKGSQTAQRTAAMTEQQRQIGLISLADEITSIVIAPLRAAVVRGIPSLARGAKERLLSRQNAIIARRLLSDDPGELLTIPQATAPMLTGGRSIPAAVIATE